MLNAPKTNSYVEAVKRAVATMERFNHPPYSDGWYWGNRWDRFMVNPPKFKNLKEI